MNRTRASAWRRGAQVIPFALRDTLCAMESATHLEAVAAGLQGFGHPLRIRALVLLEGESSPRELAELLDAPLGVVSYHVRMLRDYGLVKCTRTAPVRGALQHYYE